MKKQDYVALSKNCKAKCYADKKQVYSQKPHTKDNHEIYSCKQFVVKKISNITMVSGLLSDHIDLINKLVVQVKEYVENLGKQAISGLKKYIFSNLLNQKQQLSDKIYNSFTLLSELQYEQITCQQLYEVLNSIKKNVKMAILQKQAEQYMKKVSKKLKSILASGLNIQQIAQEGKKSKISTEASVENPSMVSDEDMDSIDNYFASDQTSLGDISIDIEVTEQQTLNNTIIDKLQLLDQSEVKFKKNKQKLPDENFFQEKKCENKQKKSIIKDFDDKVEYQQKVEEVEQEKPKKQMFRKKVEIVQEEKKQKQKKVSDKEEEKDPNKSYVNKQQGRYYIKVCHLEKQTQKTEKSKFNIQLKVVQKVMYRLFQDKNSNKTFKKVKFIAGDENGIVVCYTNHVSQLKKGSYVVLKDCILDQFKQKSYQISSNHCSLINQKRSFNVKLQKSISRFSSLNPLIYSLQKQQSTWPSVLGIAYLDRKKYKKIQLIVQIDQIIDDEADKIECFLSDGTAQIFARIDREALPQKLLKQKGSLTGTVFFMKKLQAYEQKQGSQNLIYLKVKKQNSPILIQDMQYNDNIPIKNVNQIYKELNLE